MQAYGKTVESMTEDAVKCITRRSDWFTVNKLTLSIDKTCYSLFGVIDSNKNLKLMT